MIIIKKEDILYDLNGGKEDSELELLVEKYMLEASSCISKSRYKIFDTEDIRDILVGNDINSYCEQSKKVAIFIVTLNVDIDKQLRVLEKTDKLAYIVYDRVCSHLIEDKAEELQKEVSIELLKDSKYVLNRFSTGYGDFPIDINEKIHKILDANRLGVFLTDRNMYMPSKTISGIIAGGDVIKSFNFCKTCNLTKECKLIREGRKCFE